MPFERQVIVELTEHCMLGSFRRRAYGGERCSLKNGAKDENLERKGPEWTAPETIRRILE